MNIPPRESHRPAHTGTRGPFLRALSAVQLALLFAVTGGFTGGCAGDQTGQVVVGIVTDLPASRLFSLRIQVADGATGADASAEGVALSLMNGLPGTYVLRSESQVPVRIEVTGRDNLANNLVTRAALFVLLPGKTQFLRIALLNSCVNLNCPTAGTTCIEGVCVDALVRSDDLETYAPDKADTVECPVRSILLVTATGQPMPVRGTGTCGPGRACVEGSCRLVSAGP